MPGIRRGTNTIALREDAADITAALARKITSPKTSLDDLKLVSESLRDIASALDHIRNIDSIRNLT